VIAEFMNQAQMVAWFLQLQWGRDHVIAELSGELRRTP